MLYYARIRWEECRAREALRLRATTGGMECIPIRSVGQRGKRPQDIVWASELFVSLSAEPLDQRSERSYHRA
jgi:hypothetical protein